MFATTAARDLVYLRGISPDFSGISLDRRLFVLRQLGSRLYRSQEVGPLRLPLPLLLLGAARKIPLAIAAGGRRSQRLAPRSQGAKGVAHFQ